MSAPTRLREAATASQARARNAMVEAVAKALCKRGCELMCIPCAECNQWRQHIPDVEPAVVAVFDNLPREVMGEAVKLAIWHHGDGIEIVDAAISAARREVLPHE